MDGTLHRNEGLLWIAVRGNVAEVSDSAVVGAPAPDVEAVCWSGPLWSAIGVSAGAGTRGAVAPTRPAGAPRWAWLSWADVGPLSAGVHAERPSARWARALPLLLAERMHEAYAVECVSVVPLVGDAGLYVARAPWELPAVLRLVPRDVAWVVEGELSVVPGEALRARLRLWSLERRRLHKTLTVTGADPIELGTALEAKLRAVLDAARTPRTALRSGPLAEPYLEAVAELEVAYLLASGALAPTAAWDLDVGATRVAAASSLGLEGAAQVAEAYARCRAAAAARAG